MKLHERPFRNGCKASCSADMGKVIGKQGRIAKAIRTVMRAASHKDGKKVIVDIVE